MSIFKDHFPRMGSSGVSTGYTIDQSIRFNAADTAYMKRTPSSGGNQKKWTFSCWFKRGTTHEANGDQYSHLLGTRTASLANFFLMDLNSDNIFIQAYTSSSQTIRVSFTRKLRDPSAWYHFVLRVDTTESLAANRIRVYVNGINQVDNINDETYPTLNYDTHINGTSLEQAIGTFTGDNGSND